MAMSLSAPGAAFVRHHEGFVDHWYLDPVGVATIGIGFTWGSAAFRDWWGRNRPGQKFAKGAKMTRDEAEKCLIFMCDAEYGKAVNEFLGRAVPQHVFDGMTSPVFNLGPGSLDWKWAAAAKDGDLKEAAAKLRNTGTTARGKILKGLVSRRREEAELLEHGDYAMGTAERDALIDGVLVRGERGAPVAALQTALAALGYYTGKVDGIFGYGTEAAVLEFQRSKGLEADGYAGPVTLAALAGRAAPVPHSKVPGPIPSKGLAALVVAIILAIGAWFSGAWEWLTNLIGF